MRGGRFQQRAIEDASTRNAEALFETRTVVEIREVENRTRKDIEEKKEELRQLVGASYRDLIESADSILDMRRSCEAVSSNIAQMESGFETLQKSIAAVAPAPGREESRQRREKLFGLGSRVKYLVDTPEKIWGCLDEHLYLEGAERYMRAREVHSLLAAARGPDREMLAAFPLLKHQWPLVETFRSQIAARSRERLLEPGLTIADYAIALSATAIIDDLNSSQVFALFLECRRSWLKAQLRGSSPRGTTPVDAAACFGRIVSMIKTSLCHMGELFYEVAAGKPPMLFSTALTAPPASQLFGGIPSPDGEVELWKQHRERLETLMTPLSVAHIKDAAQEWLEACKEDVATDGKALLDQVSTAQGLADIERSIRSEAARNDSFAESMEWLAAAFGVSPDSPWDCICDLLVKEPVDLWRAVFENLFVDRTKAILDAAFAKLTVRPQVEKYLAQVVPPVAQEGVVTNRRVITRPPDGDLSWKTPIPGKRSSDGSAPAAAALVLPRGTGLGAEVAELRDLVDERLAEVLRDALPMLRSADGAVNRTADLAPYIQERCFSAVSSMVEGLEERLGELARGTATEAKGRARVVEQALLIGRFCAAMWQSSKLLPVILGHPASWSMVAAPGSGGPLHPGLVSPPGSFRDPEEMCPMIKRAGLGARRRSIARRGGADAAGSAHRHDPGSARLRELQRTLRRVSVGAHRVWVDFSTCQLATAFAQDLCEEDALGTSVPLKGWEETVIKEMEDGKEVDMQMHLPAMPSQFAVLLLYAACREVHRVGSHTLDRAVLRQFSWNLSEKVLETFEKFLSDAPAFDRMVSEKGVLQLLFDLRFLADALSGGADMAPDSLDVDDDDGAVATSAIHGKRGGRPGHQSDAALLARRRRVSALLELLWTRLDPIDWATYEQYLWQNEARHYNRCAVLFGALIQLNRLYTDVPKPPYNADTNTLNMSATCPRFSYLPISAPMLNTANGSAGGRMGLGLYDGRDSATWQSMSRNGDGFKYSFTETKEKAGLTNTPILKSFMGQVGGKIGESVGSKIGSMLSEGQVGRLKDKSAQVVSTFGDMLPVQATSLFSSFTAVAGAGKVDS